MNVSEDFDEGPWAAVSFILSSEVLSLEEMEELVGFPSPDRRVARRGGMSRNWSWSADKTEEPASLDGMLKQLEGFLERHLVAFQELPRSVKARLLVSWSPQRPQDHFFLSSEAVSLLAACGCHLVVDTM